MSINFFPSGIETIATNPRLREPHDVTPQVQNELQKLGSAFAAEQAAAVALLNSQRTPESEATFSGPAFIAGATGSKGALAMLADLFAVPARENGRSI